ncbi:MAG: hypothetical protein ISQ11_14945 [Planctomycetes bacterium]|nr:hypothetical protein [Planctomycetota bacterium]
MGTPELHIQRWYPVLRGGPTPAASFDLGDHESAEAVTAAWAALGPGERIVLRVPCRPDARARLAHLESLLEASDAREGFLEFGTEHTAVTLLPADEGAAFRGGLEMLPSDLPGGRALTALLRLASPFSMAQRFGRPELAVWTRLGRALPDGELPILPVDGRVAVRVDTAHQEQPVRVRALDRRGCARVILNVGATPASVGPVRRGADALAFLREAALEHLSTTIATGERGGCPWLAADAVSAAPGGRSGRFGVVHAHVLLDLMAQGRTELPLGETREFIDAWRHLASLRREPDPRWHDDVSRLARSLSRNAGTTALRVGAAHGSFSSAAITVASGAPRIGDWSRFNPRAPLLLDLFHFLTTTPSPDAGPDSIDDAWSRLASALGGEAREVVAASQLSHHELGLHLGLTLLVDATSAEVRGRLRPGAPSAPDRDLRHQLILRCCEVLDGERRGPWAGDDGQLEAA